VKGDGRRSSGVASERIMSPRSRVAGTGKTHSRSTLESVPKCTLIKRFPSWLRTGATKNTCLGWAEGEKQTQRLTPGLCGLEANCRRKAPGRGRGEAVFQGACAEPQSRRLPGRRGKGVETHDLRREPPACAGALSNLRLLGAPIPVRASGRG
jgi:hypothetical protein